MLLHDVADLLGCIVNRSASDRQYSKSILKILLDISQIFSPIFETFGNDFLRVLWRSNKSVLQSLVVKQINIYVVAVTCFRVNSSFRKSFASFLLRLVQLNNNTWVCSHGCQVVQLALVNGETLKNKAVYSTVRLSDTGFYQLVYDSLRHLIPIFNTSSNSSTSLGVSFRLFFK